MSNVVNDEQVKPKTLPGFVSQKQGLLLDALEDLLDKLQQPGESYYFMRFSDRVSGFKPNRNGEFPSPEGQLIGKCFELRWKRRGKAFDVLLLSLGSLDLGFEQIGGDWITCDRNASIYAKTETRFPKPIKDSDVNIGQRYFIDKQTSIVRFIALRVAKEDS